MMNPWNSSDLMTDVHGMIPWLPNNLSEGQTMRWADGLRWEDTYFHTDEEAAKLRPLEDLREDLMKERKLCLVKLYQATCRNPDSLFHQTVVILDRLLLTQELPSDISMMEAVTACYLKRLFNYRDSEEVFEAAKSLTQSLNLPTSALDLTASVGWVEKVLGEFSVTEVYTPVEWFKRMTPSRCFKKKMDKVFRHLGLHGSLAHCTPSSIAAAVILKFMGSHAEPYLHGYNLSDVTEIKEKVDWILDEKKFIVGR